MRRLGQALGVEAMSLYKHVTNKDDVLDGLIDLVLDEFALPSTEDGWVAAVRACAVSAHDALGRHPWACSLIMSRARPGRIGYMDWLLGQLRDAGFPPGLTFHAYHVLDSHILGYTLWEAGHASDDTEDFEESVANFLRELPVGKYPHFGEHVEQHLAGSSPDGVRGFEFGLDLILESLERLRPKARRSRSAERA